MNEEMPVYYPDVIEPKEAVKLIKNSRGYNWEIRSIMHEGESVEDFFKRIREWNNRLEADYGMSQM